MPDTFTILDESRATDVPATTDGDRMLLAPNDVERAFGWALKPEGFCRGDVCIPIREGSRAVSGDRVDLAGFADLLKRPLAIDLKDRAAAMGASAHDRGAALASLEAPTFNLPDLDGRMHALAAHRGTKVFLAVWASW